MQLRIKGANQAPAMAPHTFWLWTLATLQQRKSNYTCNLTLACKYYCCSLVNSDSNTYLVTYIPQSREMNGDTLLPEALDPLVAPAHGLYVFLHRDHQTFETF